MKRLSRIAIVSVVVLILTQTAGLFRVLPCFDASAAAYRISGTVTANQLNLRKGPGTACDRLATLKKGHSVTVIGRASSSDGKQWYQVETTVSGKKLTGYVWADYVKTTQTVPSVTPTPKPTATPKPTNTPTPTITPGTEYAGRIGTVTVTRMILCIL